MAVLGIFCFVTLASGSIWGRQLALNGVTSENALNKYQQHLVLFLYAIALFLGVLIVIDKFNLAPLLPKILPSVLLLYLGAYYLKIIFVSGFFFLGLLITLELTGKIYLKKIIELLVGLGAISLALSFLFHILQPVTNLIEKPLIINGVVIQTTNYTCAPSAIATLARYTQTHANLTEKDAAKLAQTNRLGTTALVEIEVMEKLGLNPQYKHNLTLDDLITNNQPALLHVKERSPNKGVRFSHAVALLASDAKTKQFLIGNPYYGLQIKTPEDMEDYWFGEAIIVDM